MGLSISQRETPQRRKALKILKVASGRSAFKSVALSVELLGSGVSLELRIWHGGVRDSESLIETRGGDDETD